VQFLGDRVYDGEFGHHIAIRGENEHDVFKMPVPSNAPYQERRLPAREAGTFVWFLSLAMFRLRGRAYVQSAGRTEEQA
jgi:hypothetical protein